MPGTICAEATEFSKITSLVIWNSHSSGVWSQKTNRHVKSERKAKGERMEGIMAVRLLVYIVGSEKLSL